MQTGNAGNYTEAEAGIQMPRFSVTDRPVLAESGQNNILILPAGWTLDNLIEWFKVEGLLTQETGPPLVTSTS